MGFASRFSEDAITLAITDAVLVLSTGGCVLFAKGLRSGWIRYNWSGLLLQHIYQTSILAFAVTWTFNR